MQMTKNGPPKVNGDGGVTIELTLPAESADRFLAMCEYDKLPPAQWLERDVQANLEEWEHCEKKEKRELAESGGGR